MKHSTAKFRFSFRLAGAVFAIICAVALTACDDEHHGGSGNGGTNSNNVNTNLPASLAGKTFNMTVTGQQNNSEPVGSTFQVTFNDDSSFTYTPSPQNTDASGPAQGTYTYDPATGTITLTREGKDPMTGQLNFTTPTSGNTHLVEPDGDFLDADFTTS
jgi:hypothetical protein